MSAAADKENVKWVRFNDDQLRRIADYQASCRPVPSFAETVRSLLDEALTVKGFPPGD